MAYNNNAFCWHGVVSTDVETAKSFYGDVLGWTAQTMTMGEDEATMFAAPDGVTRAHARLPGMDGEPSHWDNYLRVDDVDASTAASAANGGSVLVPATDIPPGRFSVVTSPSGAAFCLFHEADESATNAPDGEGSIHWVELHSTSLDADLVWLKATFGFEFETMEMPQGAYHVLKSDGEMRGGATAQANEGAPSMWLTWIQLAGVDAAVERASAAGGNVLAPAFDVPEIGRMAILADPTGGVFGVITPAAQS
jgi:uncharacterized protein